MTTVVRRSIKDGVALEVKNQMLLTLLSGVGNPINVISLNSTLFSSFTASETPILVSGDVKKWRPAGAADRGLTFLKYNLPISYHRTNLLARYGRWSANVNGGVLESLGYKEGYRVDVPEETWVEAPSFHDILIFNTGHWWWAPSKFDPVKSLMLFFEKGNPVVPPVSPDTGLDILCGQKNATEHDNVHANPIPKAF